MKLDRSSSFELDMKLPSFCAGRGAAYRKIPVSVQGNLMSKMEHQDRRQ